MKRSYIIGIIFAILPLVSGQTIAQEPAYMNFVDHPSVDSVFSTLTMEEKIAQTLWVSIGPDDAFPGILKNAGYIRDMGIGGLIFTSTPGEQMQEVADFYRSTSTIAPLLALEGRWSKDFPNMTSLAAIASDSLRYLSGTYLAAQLKEKGVSLVLTKEIDDAVAEGLSENHVQLIDPKWIQIVKIDEIGMFLEQHTQADSLEQQARSVLALKYWISHQQVESEKIGQEMTQIDEPDQSAFVRDLYANSLTVLNNQEQLIPMKKLESTRIACLAVNQREQTTFQRMAGQYTRTDNFFCFPGSDNTDDLADQLAIYDVILAGIYPGDLSEETLTLLSSLKQQTKLVVVWFGEPASLKKYNLDPEGLIITYEQYPIIEGLSAQLIFGGSSGKGRLPVAIGDQYPVGHGISTPGGIRLQYGFPENAGLNSSQLHHSIDSIVNGGLEAGAYPGCQVIIARKGTVVFQKAYGYHTYEKRIKVRNNDLYDLASVTKISGPLPGLMLLEGLGKFSYQDQLGDYCTAMKGSDKADLELKDVLAHRSGLFPWIPYHELTLKKNGQYKKRYVRTDPGGKFTVQVADRVYLSNTFKEDKIFKTIRKSALGEQKYVYSGLSFFLFPTIIENLSGVPYETYLSEQIYHKLGAWELLFHPRSSYPGTRIVPTEIDSVFRKQMMHGYVHDEGAALMGAYAGNAGLFASSNDLLKLIEMYRRMGSYGGEQIIKEEVLREYTSYQFPELEIRRGLGFDKPLLGERDGTPGDYPCPGAPPASFGHSGFTGTYVWADPENEISYVFLSNRVHNTRTNQLLYEMNIRTNILQSVYNSIIDP